MIANLKDYALTYAARGWLIFPLKSNDKIPLTRHGVKDATTNTDQIARWWYQFPHANIGLDCERSGLVVIDVDAKDGGLAAWAKIDPHVHTLMCRTGGGGLHIYYCAPEGVTIKNSVGKLGKGIDVRAAGGYVVLPPSIHPNGQRYEWVEQSTEIARNLQGGKL